MDSFGLQTPELEYDYFCEQQSNGAAAVKAGNHKISKQVPGGQASLSGFNAGGGGQSKRKIRTANILTAKRGTPSSFKATMKKAELGVKRSQGAQKGLATRKAKATSAKKSQEANPFGAAPANLF